MSIQGCHWCEGKGCYHCCRACNLDQHVCPGCGENIPHGTSCCEECDKL